MKLFLSYASGDREFAARLASDLGRHRFSVWWDFERVNPGSDINEAIVAAIVASDWFTVSMSARATASEWVLREVELAHRTNARSGKPVVIPLLIEDCRLPETLDRLAHADFRYQYEDGLESLLRTTGSPYRRGLLERLLSESETIIRAAWASMPLDQQTWCLSELELSLTSSESADGAAAVTALAQVAPERLRPHLKGLLAARSASRVRRALLAVGTLRDRTLAPVVSGLASHSNPEIRQAAREALRRIR